MSTDKIVCLNNANWTEKALVKCTRFEVFNRSYICFDCCNADICDELRKKELADKEIEIMISYDGPPMTYEEAQRILERYGTS
jgi:hypothetical protein